MKILSTIRKILLHVCVVCSLVSITAKILDWYNPYMDFSRTCGRASDGVIFCGDSAGSDRRRKYHFRKKIPQTC